jgi:hypothetical protein
MLFILLATAYFTDFISFNTSPSGTYCAAVTGLLEILQPFLL